jgi:translocation and assembly module TamA
MRGGRWRSVAVGAFAVVLALGLALATPPSARADVPYTVDIQGAGDGRLGDALRASSDLVALADQPPPTLTALGRRTAGDVERLMRVLRAFGYFDATVTPAIETEATPARVTLAIVRGADYPVVAFDVVGTDGRPLPREMGVDPTALGIALGRRYRAEEVESATQRVLADLGERAWPFATMVERKIVVDRAARDVRITFVVDPGPATRFGAVDITGLADVDEAAVRELVPIRAGELARDSVLADTRRQLYRTGLFRSVQVTLDPPAADGVAPVRIALEEAPLRTIGGGVRYDSTDGFGARAFWEHRNFFGERERFRSTIDVAQYRRALDLTLTNPDFLAYDQDLVTSLSLADENFDAYDSRKAVGAIGLERRFDTVYSGRVGLSAEYSRIDDKIDTRRFTLLGVPVGLRRDTTDDLLDPTEGSRLDVGITPYLDLTGETGPFTPMLLTGSTYFKFADDPRVILAVRGSIGSIQGPATSEIPADKRFYAGGGDTIRGFAYQQAGPLDAKGTPSGGRSVVTGGIELRVKVTEDIGIVPFVDAGTVDSGSVPDLANGVFAGAGLGLRYHTMVGPLRLDVATPIQGKRSSDAPVQLYISLGQAF